MENVKKFYDALASDEALRGRADALSEKYGETKPDRAALAADFISFAKAEGYDFSEKDLADYTNQPYPLSDDELDAVSGGAKDTAACFCTFGGGGTQNGITCACVLGGGGAGSPGPKLVCPILGSPHDWEGSIGGSHGI
ncbi:MAG: Nif11-like leader peptide family RiPP precursor [Oscillospiraceae bacterium]|nr:Nif11-like leader peptide family RiPP precursor [Oscillospiraceae bacterium]